MSGPNAPHEADKEKPLDPAAERVRRKLVRFMIINLGILFVAVMAVVLAIVYKSLEPADGAAAGQSATPDNAATPSGEMLSGDIRLPAGSRIISHAATGNQLTLHLRLADGSEAIHIYGMHEGRPIGRFQVVHETQ